MSGKIDMDECLNELTFLEKHKHQEQPHHIVFPCFLSKDLKIIYAKSSRRIVLLRYEMQNNPKFTRGYLVFVVVLSTFFLVTLLCQKKIASFP